MLDSSGHLVHIDFGFIFDISPAKDLKFESAAFKLTTEMVELLGGYEYVWPNTAMPLYDDELSSSGLAQQQAAQTAASASALSSAAAPGSSSSAAAAAAAQAAQSQQSSGSQPSLYPYFCELVCRGFLAVRERRREIIALVQPMLGSSLTCFKPLSLSLLEQRFYPSMTDAQVCVAMRAQCEASRNKLTTNLYDKIQAAQQNVYYYKSGQQTD